jgi:hypothetical protein
MNIDLRNRIISLVLFVVILVLAYLLYDSITTPYEKVKQQQALTEAVRNRMTNVRTALNRYKLANENKFPANLDSLMLFVRTDSATVAMSDSLFMENKLFVFNIDSLIFSPRDGSRFYYSLNDTIRPNIYLLKDINSKDVIGDTLRTTSLNAASWE